MGRRISSYLRRVVGSILGRPEYDKRVKKLYDEGEFLEAYSAHTDIRVEADAHEAIGGMWEEIGKLQFDFLVASGLQPHHRMLDIGCGTLRGGRHFIGYLNPGGYSGMDISAKAIEYGKKLVRDENLTDKRPRLLVNKHKDLRFEEFTGERFDYLLAQSVFTHLMPDHIEECFEHIGRIMEVNSLFFFTYNKAPEFQQVTVKDFKYPFCFFESLADKYGFDLQDRSEDYGHPRGQEMVSTTRRKKPGS